MSESYIEESKKGWYRAGDAKPTNEDLILGCLQRIATATELSCKDRERLERDYRHMQQQRDRYRQDAEQMARRIAALKGQITKMKRAATQGAGHVE